MTSSVVTTGIKGNTYKALLRKHILHTKPSVVGLAVAYVSASGFNIVKSILDEGGVDEVRLVADTKDGVTHPKALQIAMDSGWGVRVVDSLPGTFHPKLYVGADSFNETKGVAGLSLVIAGSQNLSLGAFSRNGECAFWSVAPHSRESAAQAWLDCWQLGVPLTKAKLRDYEKYFALRNRYRRPEDLVTLGVADSAPKATTAGGAPPKTATPPKTAEKAISETAASVAWAGLQSFTGEYNLQVEFPKEAGLVLRRVFGKPSKDGSIDILCADGITRTFKFRFYDDNGMFRLNVPNAAPLVDWARGNKAGIAYVEHNEAGVLAFKILKPGQPLMDVVDRSLALGTWGRTPTRLYGWY